MIREAMLYEKAPEGRLHCFLCAHHCRVAPGKSGVCGVREHSEGRMITRAWGRVIAANVDPIEKKPLYHFLPGSRSFSVGTLGCNFQCPFCQNWEISQSRDKEELETSGIRLLPEEIVSRAREHGCRSIAYTYTEPTIFFEYAHDTAREAKAAELYNVFVTNGYMTSEALDAAKPWLDACNVDLKSFRDRFYRNVCRARLKPVLDTISSLKDLGIWLEVTTLVIPGINDDLRELRDAAEFIATELGVDTPWHISRFFPAHKMTHIPPTPAATLTRARETGLRAGLRYVYVGNVPGEENTFCRKCGRLLIRRDGYLVVEKHIRPNGRCPNCGTSVAGEWATEVVSL